MGKKFTHILEYNSYNYKNVIEAKMRELSELIKDVSTEKLIYEYSDEDEHLLTINFSHKGSKDPIKYDFDIRELTLTKYEAGEEVYSEKLNDIEEGLDIIESDINTLHSIDENNN